MARIIPTDRMNLRAENERLVHSLAERYLEVLRVALNGATTVALVDFPNYPNVGDSLIWLGQCKALKSLHVRVSYTCTVETFDESRLSRALPNGAPILFSGGGNLGDLYPRIQGFRSQLLTTFNNHPFVQLPQTIHFTNTSAADAFGEDMRRHGGVTLCVRDSPSVAAALAMGVDPLLAPDAAFVLGPLLRGRPLFPTIELRRTDEETSAEHSGVTHQTTAPRFDWISVPTLGPIDRLYDLLYLSPRRRSFALLRPWLPVIQRVLPAARLREGIRLLSQGSVVVTDRLHAHILCLLLGIPHVMLDNSYGKLRAFRDAWTAPSPLVVVKQDGMSLDDAVAAAHRLLPQQT